MLGCIFASTSGVRVNFETDLHVRAPSGLRLHIYFRSFSTRMCVSACVSVCLRIGNYMRMRLLFDVLQFILCPRVPLYPIRARVCVYAPA